MTWRDEPETIWQDEHGCQLHVGPLAMWTRQEKQLEVHPIDRPATPVERDEMLHRLAAALGRRIVGIEAAPRPIEEGDRVVTVDGDSPFGPLAVLGGPWDSEMGPGVAVRDGSGTLWLVRTSRLSHVEDALELEPEPEIIEQGDRGFEEWTRMLAGSAGPPYRIEVLDRESGAWEVSRLRSESEFRVGVLAGNRYRIIVRGGDR